MLYYQLEHCFVFPFISIIWHYTFIAKQEVKRTKETLKGIKFQSDKKANAPTMYKVQYKPYICYRYMKYFNMKLCKD